MVASTAPKNSTTVRSQTPLRLARAALHAAYLVSEDLGTGLAERLFTTPRRHTRPPAERDVLAVARRSRMPITLRSPRWGGKRVEVAVWRWGLGPTVLLVHGWEGRGSQLGSFVAPLVAAGMSVVAFDAPAHGDSPGDRLYLTDHADAIADVATAVGPLHAIVAHSFGAAAVLLAHARHGIDAPRNVFLAPNVLIDDSIDRFARTVGLDDADRGHLEHAVSLHTGLTVEDLALEPLVEARSSGLLVIHDRDDREVSFAHATRLVATWPNARLESTTGLGHRRLLRDPAVIRQVVDAAREGVPLPASDLVREVDRLVDALEV